MNARVEEVFHQVANLPPKVRTLYFVEHGVDEETRREVELLLTFDDGDSTFLRREIGAAAGRALPQLDAAGGRCGPYRLLHLIGRGGMGAVYLAERADGEVTQRVAVKLLPPGAGGLELARFLQERQILATLSHPNIARLLDAGHLEHGGPFLVMEYVDGQPIDKFTAGLTLRQKLALFVRVCAAVAYLHRHLIVHRDLKPSNIFVAADGEPKLLDFGIAKLLDSVTNTTVTVARMLTPDYASPEQMAGGKLTTTSDIYSLGAVLYLLLTGKPAHEFGERSPEAIAVSIATHDVARPSTWVPELKGDIDVILLKALRKDPQERYETVEQFADDLLAFLESRPVRARSDSAWYRTRKFLRRHWLPVAAGAVVVASLAAGLYVANRERAVAQRRFADVRQLANKLADIDGQVRLLAGSTKARQLIVDTSLEYLRRLTADAKGDPELALEVATAYIFVAQVEGVTTGPNLGQLDNAERDLSSAEDLIRTVLEAEPTHRTAMFRAAQIAAHRMNVAWQGGRTNDTMAFAQRAADWLQEFDAGSTDRAEAALILNTYVNVAHQYMLGERFDDALRMCRRGIELATVYDRPLDRGGFLEIQALARRYQGDLDGALAAAREALALADSQAADGTFPQAMNLVLALTRVGWILGEDQAISLGRPDAALPVLERAFTIADGFVHKDPLDESSRSRLFLAGFAMGDILRHTDANRALKIYDHTLADMDAVDGKFLRLRAVYLLAGSSYALRRLGRPNDARQRLDRAFATLEALQLYPSNTIESGSEAIRAVAALADHEAATGNVGGALELYERLLDGLSRSTPPETSLATAVDVSNIYESMERLQRISQRDPAASALNARRLELWRHWDRRLPENPFVRRQLAAAIH